MIQQSSPSAHDDIPEPLRSALAAARAEPENAEAWAALDEAARECDQPDEASALYQEVLQSDLGAVTLLSLGERAVAFHDEWFDDPDYNIRILKRLTSLDAGGDWAFEKLSLLLTMEERWEELLAEYDRKLSRTSDAEKRRPLLEEAARIAKDFAGQGDRASDYLKELLLTSPDNAQLAEALERRLERQNRHQDLIEIWGARLSNLPPAEALATRVQIADRQLKELGDAVAALRMAEEILQLEQGEDDACRLLEQIAERATSPVAARRRALEILRERYASARRPEDVIRVLELSLNVVETEGQERELRESCASWLIKIERHEDALTHAAALLRLAPDSNEVHAQLRGLADRTGRHDLYASALVAASESSASDERRIELLVEAGKVYEAKVADPSSATELYVGVLDDPRAGEEPRLFAARRLRQLLADAGDQDRLLSVLERLAVLEPNLRGQRQVLAEAAKLADDLGDIDRSLELWQRCLEVSEGDLSALDARIAILERAERWDPLIDDLRRRAQASTKAGARRNDLVRVARIYETRLFRLESAIDVWRDIEQQFGSNAQTVDALVDLCTAANRHGDVIGLLSTAVQSEPDARRRTDQLARLGDVYREHEKSPGRAIEYYRQALELNALHEAARSGLRALLGNEAHAHDAVETLASALTAADEWPGVLELVELRVRSSAGPTAARGVLLEAANILEQRAQDPSGALTYLCRAFELDPNSDLEGELRRLARSSGEWGVAVAGYQRAIDRCKDAERGRELRFARGQILEERMEDRDAALACYRQILETDPAHRDAACAAARVATRVRAWHEVAWALVQNSIALGFLDRKVAEAVEQAAESARSWEHTVHALLERVDATPSLPPRVAHDLRRQLGLWYRDHRQDPKQAEALLSLAVQSQSEPDTLRMLAELRRRTPERPLVETLLQLADAVTPDDLSVLREAADVALDVVHDSALAKPILERALRSSGAAMNELAERTPDAVLGSLPDRVAWWSLEELVKLEKQRGGFSQALRLLVDGSALPFDRERSISLSYQAAELAVDALNDPDLGAEICRSLLAKAPDHWGTIELLGSIYERGQRYADLLELRRQELALSPPLERRLELRLDEARILDLVGESPAQRIEVLQKNVEEAPGHAPSLDALERILASSGEHAGLYALLTQQAKRVAGTADREAAAMLWARAGQLSQHSLNNVDQAFAAYEASVALSPTPEVLDALAELSAARGQHDAAVHWLEQRLELTPESNQFARRKTLLGLCTALRAAGNDERARGYLTDALRADPAAVELRSLLAESYRAQGNWMLLGPLLSAGVEHASDPAIKAQYLRDAARVHQEHLGQLDEAIPLLQQAVQLEPADRELRLSLADMLRQQERYEEARQLLTSLLEEFGRRRTPERARVHFQLAQIARAAGDLDVALTELELASKIDRNNLQMLKLLGEVAREKGQLEESERAYRALLLLLARHRSDGADAQAGIGESSILFELYRIANELGQHERAKDLLDSALEAGSQDNEEAQRLEAALREAGHHDLLLRALEQRMHHAKDPATQSAILRSRAEVLVGLGQRDAALDCRLQALLKNPSTKSLIKETWELAQEIGRTDLVAEQLSTLAEKAESEDPELACDLWLSLGRLVETTGDNARAARCFTRAQATGRKPLECLEAVERAGVGGDPKALAQALRSFVENADPDAAPERYTEVLYRLGTLDLYQGRPRDAVQHLDVALTRDGNSRRVLELLRASLAANPPSAEVVELLERVARDTDDKAALLLSLTHAARLRRATLESLHEAVELAREAHDEPALRAMLDATVKLARDQERVNEAIWAISALADLLERDGQPKAAVDLLQESIPHAGIQEAFELRLRLATLAQNTIGDLELASTVYEQLLEEEPTSVRVWKPLFDVYRKTGDRQKLEHRISSIEKAVDDPALRHSLRLERMRILIDSDRKQEAEAALRAVLDEDPESEEASRLLEDLLEQQGRLSELHGVIERRLSAARDRGDKAAITTATLQLGKILAGTDREAAIDMYRSSVAMGGDSREVLLSFLELLDGEQHISDRARTLYQLIALESGPAAEARTLELVSLHKAQDDFIGVERALLRGLERLPQSEALHAERVQWYRQHDAWDKLAEALCDHAAHLGDAAQKREQIEQAALIYERQLNDPRRAAETLERATDPASPDRELLAQIAQHWLAADEPSRALAHLSRAIDLYAAEDAELGALFHLRGTLRLGLAPDDLDNLALAIEDLTRASRLSPERAKRDLCNALTAKLDLLEARGDPETRPEQGAITLEVARVLSELGQIDDAQARVSSWAMAHPEDKAAQRELGRLAAQGGDWDKAAAAYRALVPLCTGPEQVAVALDLAEACERLGDPMAAKDTLELVHAQFPAEDAIRKRLRKMYQAAKAYRGWANLLVAEAESTQDKAQRFDLLCNAGDLYRQAPEGALEEARAAYEKALTLVDDAKTIVKLVEVEVELDQIEAAAARLEEAIRNHGKRRSPELSLLQHAMARVATAAGDEEAIFAWLEAALASDRQNGAVASELAALAMSRGEFDVAIKALQLVTLLKTPGPMSRAEAYLRQAAIAKHRGDLKKSALLAKRAITTDPAYQEARAFLGELEVSGDSLPPPPEG
ncbi:MAG TPA: tetratricopeptide repeat protein [Polyangiaceae bacterium]|nr:tetratricopeptide repeat protein [Polyangiaceae bacterium]